MTFLLHFVAISWFAATVAGTEIFELTGTKSFHEVRGATIDIKGTFKICKPVQCPTCIRVLYVNAGAASTCVAVLKSSLLPLCKATSVSTKVKVPSKDGTYSIRMYFMYEYRCKAMSSDGGRGMVVGSVQVGNPNFWLEGQKRFTAKPGGTIWVRGCYKYCREDLYCPTCVRQVYVQAARGKSLCIASFFQNYLCKPQCFERHLVVPTTPGIHDVRMMEVYEYKCRDHNLEEGITVGKVEVTDINECLNGTPCKNGGTCVNTVGSYLCRCPTGIHGRNCEKDKDECPSHPCRNGATCINTVGSYKCICSTGWTGNTCDKDEDECKKSPCQNGGGCTNTPGSYSCTCLSGWTGNNCDTDVDECLKNPCNNAICNNEPGGYSCACKSGWQGESCSQDINECQNNPCQHGGLCSNTPGSYYCDCEPGWQGDTCADDTNECDKGVCQNGADCENNHGSFRCICSQGYYGSLCEMDIDECMNFPCLNGGTCINRPGTFYCKCPYGYSGQFCDNH